MDEQKKEIEEILRMFDKAPSPSSERNDYAQIKENVQYSRLNHHHIRRSD